MLACVDIKKPTFSTILECLESLGHFGSVWVIWVLCGPLRACFWKLRSFLSQGPRKAGASMQFRAISSVSSNPLEFRATSRNFEHQPEFRANGLYFEQSQSWLNKDQPMDFRATRLSFEQPARISSNQPEFRATSPPISSVSSVSSA